MGWGGSSVSSRHGVLFSRRAANARCGRVRWRFCCPGVLQEAKAALVDSGLMPAAAPSSDAANGLPAANILTADQDQDLVF